MRRNQPIGAPVNERWFIEQSAPVHSVAQMGTFEAIATVLLPTIRNG